MQYTITSSISRKFYPCLKRVIVMSAMLICSQDSTSPLDNTGYGYPLRVTIAGGPYEQPAVNLRSVSN